MTEEDEITTLAKEVFAFLLRKENLNGHISPKPKEVIEPETKKADVLIKEALNELDELTF